MDHNSLKNKKGDTKISDELPASSQYILTGIVLYNTSTPFPKAQSNVIITLLIIRNVNKKEYSFIPASKGQASRHFVPCSYEQ